MRRNKLEPAAVRGVLSVPRADRFVPYGLESKLRGLAEVGIAPDMDGGDMGAVVNLLVIIQLDRLYLQVYVQPVNEFGLGVKFGV